jgi:hypothetical protein
MRVTLAEIERAASGFHGGIDLKRRDNRPGPTACRRSAYHAARYLGYSLNEIGRYFERDHTTIMWALQNEVADDELYAIVEAARRLALLRVLK